MFRVRWKQSALNELASIWLSADSATRSAITSAAYAIERRLPVNPNHQGESRPEGRRIDFESPLGFQFRVFPEDLVV
jgi:hypothetical protein